jgi:hypothetical protein
MKLSVLLMFISFSSIASEGLWRSGDVILIPLNCYSCRYIESESGAPFSHSGVLLKIKGKWRVAQSLGEVSSLEVEKFLSMGRKGEKALLLRAKFLDKKISSQSMNKIFKRDFKGLGFDPSYRWDNFAADGTELLYCSEFVTKFLNRFLTKKIIPSKMDYSHNYDYWLNYFAGDVPQNELGNSPADFYFSKEFIKVEEIAL